MYYEVKGYNAAKAVQGLYTDVAFSKSEKNEFVKQYKRYLQNNEIDSFKVVSYRNDGELKSVVTYA